MKAGKTKKIIVLLMIIVSFFVTTSIEHLTTFNMILISVLLIKKLNIFSNPRQLFMLLPLLSILPEYLDIKIKLISQILIGLTFSEIINVLPKHRLQNLQTFTYFVQIFFWTIVTFLDVKSNYIDNNEPLLKQYILLTLLHHIFLPLVYTIICRNDTRSRYCFTEGCIFLTCYIVTTLQKQYVKSYNITVSINKLRILDHTDAINIISSGNFDSLIQETRKNIYDKFSTNFILNEKEVYRLLSGVNPNSIDKYLQLIDTKNTPYIDFKEIIKRNPSFYLNLIYTISNILSKSFAYTQFNSGEVILGKHYKNISINGFIISSVFIILSLFVFFILAFLLIVRELFIRKMFIRKTIQTI